jgi:hypothetical protein
MEAPQMKRWLWKSAAAISLVALSVLLSFCAFVAWVKMYPVDVDPKNIEYVLWAHGLNQNMNLDHALDGMTHDKWPERLVIGLSKEQLKERFGYIRTWDEAPDLRGCYPATNELVFLRHSRWIVVLDRGRAVKLVLCKG